MNANSYSPTLLRALKISLGLPEHELASLLTTSALINQGQKYLEVAKRILPPASLVELQDLLVDYLFAYSEACVTITKTAATLEVFSYTGSITNRSRVGMKFTARTSGLTIDTIND